MTLLSFIRLMLRNWKWLLLLPLLAAVTVYIFELRAEKKYDSSMQIYTGFASGYTIGSIGGQKFDYYAVNNALDNLINIIKSDVVLENVALKLVAQSLIYGPRKEGHKYINSNSYQKLAAIIPSDIKALIDTSSVEVSTDRLKQYMNRDNSNFMYKLLNLYHPNFSIWALQKIDVKKVGQSDLLQINFTSNDPALCYQTLVLLNDEFMANYRWFHQSETMDVVKYFQDQLAMSDARLNDAEDEYMKYNKAHRVINYYEQTKSIAGQLQAFELNYDQLLSANSKSKESALRLESKLGMYSALTLKSNQVLKKRNQIAQRTAEITAQSLFLNDSMYMNFNDTAFDQAIKDGQIQLKGLLDTINIYKNSPEGIQVENILNQWLDQIVLYDATNAALAVMDKRRLEIEYMFDYYAPVGATVKRKEREIGVNEREYLSLLNSLAEAKLRQQQIAMSSSSLRVAQDPQFPINAKPSKRKVLALVTFFVVFMMVATVVLLIEFTDRTLRDALRTKRFSGLDVAGVVPFDTSVVQSCIKELNDLSTSQLVAQILRLAVDEKPTYITLLSMDRAEGKSYIAKKLEDRFLSMGYSVTSLSEVSDFNPQSKEYAQAKTPKDLTTNQSSDIYITELPEATFNITPTGLIQSSSLTLLVCRANRSWQQSNSTTLTMIGRIDPDKPIFALLNGVGEQALDPFMGELPKAHTALHDRIKKVITRQFTSHSKII